MANGLAEEDFAATIKFLERNTGVEVKSANNGH
jgi:hypothetical protein